MAVKFAVDKLRARASRLHKEYEALGILSNSLTTTDWALLDSLKNLYAEANKARLRDGIARLEDGIAKLRRDFGFRISNTEALEIVERFREWPDNRTPLMNKQWVEAICTGYTKYWNQTKDLPAHALIEINIGKQRKTWGELTWYLLEAIAFEDMCALFNQAREFDIKLNDSVTQKSIHKTHDSLMRATILAAYHFIEAYLNGISFDYFSSNRDKVDQRTAEILFDWNFKTHKPKYLSIRDKVLQYPKIILGLAHPPIQESNSPELRFILEHVERTRHRFTHISPMKEFELARLNGPALYYNVTLPEVEEIVDSSIRLVRRIESTIRGNINRLTWLFDRLPDGSFPIKVFD